MIALFLQKVWWFAEYLQVLATDSHGMYTLQGHEKEPLADPPQTTS